MNMCRQPVLLLILLLTSLKSICQHTHDSALERTLVANIYNLQIHHEKEFLKGVIPSYREYRQRGIRKNDTNIFFTALSVFTLRAIYQDLSLASQSICDSIFLEAAKAFTFYKNRKGRPTYNFWRTDKPEIFPHAGWLNLFNKSHAPADDLDDTAIILMALGSSNSTVDSVHNIMQDFTNKNLAGSLPAYHDLQGYSAWFGKKTPVELDFGVISNILYMVHKYNIPYNKADSASLEFLCRVVKNRDYVNASDRLSPYYNRAPVLLYHLARLMSIAQIPELEKWKPQLIKDAGTYYQQADNLMDKIMLSTTLLRWGVMLPDERLVINAPLTTVIEKSDFVFFMANITTMLPRPFNRWLYKTGMGTFYYYSAGWNYALMLENMAVRKRSMVNGEWGMVSNLELTCQVFSAYAKPARFKFNRRTCRYGHPAIHKNDQVPVLTVNPVIISK